MNEDIHTNMLCYVGTCRQDILHSSMKHYSCRLVQCVQCELEKKVKKTENGEISLLQVHCELSGEVSWITLL